MVRKKSHRVEAREQGSTKSNFTPLPKASPLPSRSVMRTAQTSKLRVSTNRSPKISNGPLESPRRNQSPEIDYNKIADKIPEWYVPNTQEWRNKKYSEFLQNNTINDLQLQSLNNYLKSVEKMSKKGKILKVHFGL